MVVLALALYLPLRGKDTQGLRYVLVTAGTVVPFVLLLALCYFHGILRSPDNTRDMSALPPLLPDEEQLQDHVTGLNEHFYLTKKLHAKNDEPATLAQAFFVTVAIFVLVGLFVTMLLALMSLRTGHACAAADAEMQGRLFSTKPANCGSDLPPCTNLNWTQVIADVENSDQRAVPQDVSSKTAADVDHMCDSFPAGTFRHSSVMIHKNDDQSLQNIEFEEFLDALWVAYDFMKDVLNLDITPGPDRPDADNVLSAWSFDRNKYEKNSSKVGAAVAWLRSGVSPAEYVNCTCAGTNSDCFAPDSTCPPDEFNVTAARLLVRLPGQCFVLSSRQTRASQQLEAALQDAEADLRAQIRIHASGALNVSIWTYSNDDAVASASMVDPGRLAPLLVRVVGVTVSVLLLFDASVLLPWTCMVAPSSAWVQVRELVFRLAFMYILKAVIVCTVAAVAIMFFLYLPLVNGCASAEDALLDDGIFAFLPIIAIGVVTKTWHFLDHVRVPASQALAYAIPAHLFILGTSGAIFMYAYQNSHVPAVEAWMLRMALLVWLVMPVAYVLSGSFFQAIVFRIFKSDSNQRNRCQTPRAPLSLKTSSLCLRVVYYICLLLTAFGVGLGCFYFIHVSGQEPTIPKNAAVNATVFEPRDSARNLLSNDFRSSDQQVYFVTWQPQTALLNASQHAIQGFLSQAVRQRWITEPDFWLWDMASFLRSANGTCVHDSLPHMPVVDAECVSEYFQAWYSGLPPYSRHRLNVAVERADGTLRPVAFRVSAMLAPHDILTGFLQQILPLAAASDSVGYRTVAVDLRIK